MNRPRIGIRPTIDGRWGGVRESLEEKTMAMAYAAKELIENNVYYQDGNPVECVISSCTIGGGAEAAQCSEFFDTQNVCATLAVTPCWCYGSETMDLNPNTIKAVWGFNGTERPGAVYLAAVMAAFAQRGLPAFAMYSNEVQDIEDNTVPSDVAEKMIRWAKGAVAVGQMKDKAYVNLGGVAMGIAGSYCDMSFMQKYLGVRAEWVDLTEILRRITLEIYDKNEYEKALKWIKANCKEGFDKNEGKSFPEIITKSKVIPADKDWEFIAKFTIIVNDILYGNPKLGEMGWHEEALGKNGIVGGFQGQRNWTDWLPNADFTESVMASSFDWNGKKMPTPFATENDTLNGISMLFGTLLTGKAPAFHDVRTYWGPESVERVTGQKLSGKAERGIIHLINSGATAMDCTCAAKDSDGNGTIKEWWNMSDDDISECLKATDWCRADYEYFRGGGFSSHFRTQAEIPVTMLRINLIEGIGPVMQIAEGYTCVLAEEIHSKLDKRTDPTWPTTWFAPRLTGKNAFKDVYSVMANWGANHSVTVGGHVGADIITLCSMLRIPVAMHNVDENKIYRPHAWSAFGTEDSSAADYSACEKYGPLYK
ncbi:MAG: L-fucose isomerase [Clostridia bacterium]|nr:L-fucose isomerase [Clostridia bacterium]MCI8980631.1 L-fucose isomerase [Clostridia bacterium]MCI9086635.1 L-fucose isomerase [Clostridia bacterium]